MVQKPAIEVKADSLKVSIPLEDIEKARDAADVLKSFFPYIASITGNGTVRHEVGTEKNEVGANFNQTDFYGRTLKYSLVTKTPRELKFNVFDEKAVENFEVLIEFDRKPSGDTHNVIVTSRPITTSKVWFDFLTCCCLCFRKQIFISLISQKVSKIEKNALRLQHFLITANAQPGQMIAVDVDEKQGSEAVGRSTVRAETNDETLELSIPVLDIQRAKVQCRSLETVLTLLLPALEDGTVQPIPGTPSTGVGAMWSHYKGAGKTDRYSVTQMTDEAITLQNLDDASGQLAITFEEEDGTGTVLVTTKKPVLVNFFTRCFPAHWLQALLERKLEKIEKDTGALQHFLNSVPNVLATPNMPTFTLPELGTVGPMTVQSLNSTITKEDHTRFSEIRSVLTGTVNESPYTIVAESLIDVTEAVPKKLTYQSVRRITASIAESLKIEEEAEDSDDEEEVNKKQSKLTREFQQPTKPNIGLDQYLTRLVDGLGIWYNEQTVEIGLKTIIYANELLQRMQQRDEITVNAFNVHRLFAILTLLSAKIMSDRVISNSGWALVAGIDVEVVTRLEDLLCFELDFNFLIGEEELLKVFEAHGLMFKNEALLDPDFML